jgi:hypothetical protein
MAAPSPRAAAMPGFPHMVAFGIDGQNVPTA